MPVPCHTPCKFYLTLPFGAPPFKSSHIVENPVAPGTYTPPIQPNGHIFYGRHSYSLSTPEYSGDLDWFIIQNLRGGWIPQLTGSDEILYEKGIYGVGLSPVMVRAEARNLRAEISIIGTDEYHWSCIREMLAYILSWEHTSATTHASQWIRMRVPDGDTPETAMPYPDLPEQGCLVNPWTLTWDCFDCDGNPTRRHIDFHASWLNTDGTNESTTPFAVDTIWNMWVGDPRWYGDEICIDVTGPATTYINESDEANPGRPDHSNLDVDLTADGYPLGSFRYTGSARTGWRFRIDMDVLANNGVVMPITFYSVTLKDMTHNSVPIPVPYDPNNSYVDGFRRFAHWDFYNNAALGGAGGWTWDDTTTTYVEFDVENGLFLHYLGTDVSPMHQEAALDYFRSWQSIFLVPGRIYQIAFEIADGNGDPVDLTDGQIEVCYTNRYAGV